MFNEDLKIIGRDAFSYTTSIEILEIPGSVEQIESGIIRNSEIKTVMILSDPTFNIPVDNRAFIIERFFDSISPAYRYADVYISDEIYDDYISYNNSLSYMTEFYHKLSEYEDE